MPTLRSRLRAARLRLRRLAARRAGLPHVEGTVDAAPATVARDITLLWLASALSMRRAVHRSSDVVVTMTSHGARAPTAWLALESIARGTVLPGRLVLWLEDPARPGWRLRRLRRRGVDVRRVPRGLGVHAKLQHLLREAPPAGPVVTCDDDIVYPPDWLEGLLAAHRERPDCVVAYRAHAMTLTEDGLAPYTTWQPVTTRAPSLAHVATSVAGQLLPRALVDALRERGDAFLTLAPTADDLWLHATAVSIGVRTAQVGPRQVHPPHVPGTQEHGLWRRNVDGGGNDRQAAALYGPEHRARILADLADGRAC